MKEEGKQKEYRRIKNNYQNSIYFLTLAWAVGSYCGSEIFNMFFNAGMESSGFRSPMLFAGGVSVLSFLKGVSIFNEVLIDAEKVNEGPFFWNEGVGKFLQSW